MGGLWINKKLWGRRGLIPCISQERKEKREEKGRVLEAKKGLFRLKGSGYIHISKKQA